MDLEQMKFPFSDSKSFDCVSSKTAEIQMELGPPVILLGKYDSTPRFRAVIWAMPTSIPLGIPPNLSTLRRTFLNSVSSAQTVWSIDCIFLLHFDVSCFLCLSLASNWRKKGSFLSFQPLAKKGRFSVLSAKKNWIALFFVCQLLLDYFSDFLIWIFLFLFAIFSLMLVSFFN